jgi:hypothetical protein
MTHLNALYPTLQIAIGPVILISGIGLLLLSMTNRLGRTVDRSRDLAREYRRDDRDDRRRVVAQLEILLRRAQIMRAAIASAAVSLLLAALLIICLFVGALFQLDIAAFLVGMLFGSCVLSLIVSLCLFIWDVNLALRALKLEIDPLLREPITGDASEGGTETPMGTLRV